MAHLHYQYFQNVLSQKTPQTKKTQSNFKNFGCSNQNETQLFGVDYVAWKMATVGGGTILY